MVTVRRDWTKETPRVMLQVRTRIKKGEKVTEQRTILLNLTMSGMRFRVLVKARTCRIVMK